MTFKFIEPLVFSTHFSKKSKEAKADLWSDDVNRRIACAIDHGRKIGLLVDGDRVVVVAGWKPTSGTSNSVRIVQLGSLTEHNILGIPDMKNYKD